MNVAIYIETDRLELFEDENISITSSVLDIQDISKNTTDYTKSFTVPASDINNKIFKHYYDSNIDNSFDARISVDGRIEIGGVLFRMGKILLQKVNVKKGRPDNYTINFWGNLVSLKDLIGNDKLSDLDLTAYDHDYTSANVLSGLNTTANYNSIIYTLLAKKQYWYNSSSSDETMTDTTANIHYKAGTLNGVNWDDLQASLSLTSILNAIQTDYGLTFSDDFFGREEFKQLYMWLNNSDDIKSGGDTEQVEWDSGDNTFIDTSGTNEGTFITSGIAGDGGSTYFDVRCEVLAGVTTPDTNYSVDFYDNDVLISSVSGSGGVSNKVRISSNDVDGDTLEHLVWWEVVSDANLDYTSNCYQEEHAAGVYTEYLTSGTGNVGSVFLIADNIPEMKVIDFLKGIFNAFKLVVIPQDDGTIYVNNVDDYYKEGELIDITNYIDAEQVDVSRGEILNEISYKFQEPQTILNTQFETNTGLGYGDEDAQLEDENGQLLDGDSIDITLPFEQIMYERLNDINQVDDIELMYGAVIDKENKSVNPKAHVFYRQMYSVGGDGIGFFYDDGSKVAITGAINTATHVIDDASQTHSFLFSEEYNNFTGALTSNNLYTNYHEKYILDVFNVKRRNFKYTTEILPVPILLKLTLNDVLKIGYNYYRIDKFTTDLTTGKTEFNLVNAFEFDLSAFTSSDTYIILSSDAQTYSAYISNLTTYTELKVDLGHGTGWITVSSSGRFMEFTVTENTGSYRAVEINITDDVSGDTVKFYVAQNAVEIGADSIEFTADTTLITADNDENTI